MNTAVKPEEIQLYRNVYLCQRCWKNKSSCDAETSAPRWSGWIQDVRILWSQLFYHNTKTEAGEQNQARVQNQDRPGAKKKRKSEFSSPMSLFDNGSLLQYPDQNQNPTEPWFLLEPSHTDVPVVLGPPLSHVVLIAACLFCTWCV